MPRIKAMEVRLPVANVGRSVAIFQQTLDFSVATLWPEQAPAFAILERDGCRLQLGKEDQAPQRASAATLWLDVEDLAVLHQQIASQTKIEWGPDRSAEPGVDGVPCESGFQRSRRAAHA